MDGRVNYGGRDVAASTPLYLLVRGDANPDNAVSLLANATKGTNA
jgi:hypothetical protein